MFGITSKEEKGKTLPKSNENWQNNLIIPLSIKSQFDANRVSTNTKANVAKRRKHNVVDYDK